MLTLPDSVARYAKPASAFVDAIALVRRHLWIASHTFSMSASGTNIEKAPGRLHARLIDSLVYAA